MSEDDNVVSILKGVKEDKIEIDFLDPEIVSQLMVATRAAIAHSGILSQYRENLVDCGFSEEGADITAGSKYTFDYVSSLVEPLIKEIYRKRK